MFAFSQRLCRRWGRGALQQTRWLSSVSGHSVNAKPAIGSKPSFYVPPAADDVHVKQTPARHPSQPPPEISGPKLTIPDRDGKTHEVDSLWLRDHCKCAKCVNQETMQRKFDTFSLPTDDPGTVVENNESLRVQWQDGHVSEYDWGWLRSVGLHTTSLNPQIETHLPQRVYFGSEISASPPSVDYAEIMSGDPGVGEWTNKILKYGFCYVDNCPVSPEKTEELLERIGPIRVTHYGGFYDFTSDLSMKDTAYTSEALGAHTDNAYFTEPSRLQMFHLLSHTDGEGGASLLVDGYKCLKILQDKDPDAYKVLRTTPLRWHASGNEGITITSWNKMPVIGSQNTGRNVGLSLPSTEDTKQLRWNNDDRATLWSSSKNSVSRWYAAARQLDSIIKDQKSEYWEQLRPGRPLIFDNWRVLHGRSAFTGKRRICGGYIMGDDFMSRYLNTNFPRETILKRYL